MHHIFCPIGDHRCTGQVECVIHSLRTRIGACRFQNPAVTAFPQLIFRVLQDLRHSIYATTNTSPFSLYFARTPKTPFSNFFHAAVSDLQRILEKGNYYNAKTSSPKHFCHDDSASDTDDDQLSVTRVPCSPAPLV